MVRGDARHSSSWRASPSRSRVHLTRAWRYARHWWRKQCGYGNCRGWRGLAHRPVRAGSELCVIRKLRMPYPAMNASWLSKKSRRPSAANSSSISRSFCRRSIGIQALGQPPSNLIEHEAHQRFCTGDVGGRDHQVQRDRSTPSTRSRMRQSLRPVTLATTGSR